MHTLILVLALYKFNIIVSEEMKPLESRIVGGQLSDIRHFSYSAFIHLLSDMEAFVCGSSIINQRIILTAAHCLEGYNRNKRIIVTTGNANKLKGTSTTVRRFKMHEMYDRVSIDNDIALAMVKTPFKFNKFVSKVALMRNPPKRSKAVIAGWGLVDESYHPGMGTNLLHHAQQRVLPRSRCQGLIPKLPKGTICGDSMTSSGYASNGDSGSALVVDGFIQIGIVSFKRPLISSAVVIYTDVTYFYDWINKNSELLYCRGP